MTDAKPILFSGEMVRAIKEGRKRRTRRVVKPQPLNGCGLIGPNTYGNWEAEPPQRLAKRDIDAGALAGRDEWVPRWKAGDLLWVRETWRPFYDEELYTCVQYAADGEKIKPTTWDDAAGFWCETEMGEVIGGGGRWRPSIHMPRWACRLELRVVSVRAERLQEIDEADAEEEGATPYNAPLALTRSDKSHDIDAGPFKKGFALLWGTINGRRGFPWCCDPWVWVVEFEREP